VRAVAVIAVMLFHATLVPNAPFHVDGGFFGVDVFFVLSGFLITTLLVEEFQRTSSIRFRSFYARRALRLLPAIAVVLVAVLVYAQVNMPSGEAHYVHVGALWTAVYGINWYFVVQHSPFLTLTLLGHAWSLSIEEQFYLVWPLVLLGLLRLRLTARTLVLVALSGAALSAIVMVAVAPRGLAGEFHALYGTDARAQGILLGAALGLAAVNGMLPTQLGARTALTVAGWGAAALLVLAFAGIVGSRSGSWLENGGYALIAVAAAAVLAHLVVAPSGVMARTLALRPVRGIGRISYGLYLWHLPVFLVLDHRRTGLTFWPLVVVQFGVTFTAAIASFVLVERPALRLKRRFERVGRPAESEAGRVPGVTVRP
jgi:peptidoglycan/LPS O-acetylase OafA/YrhL